MLKIKDDNVVLENKFGYYKGVITGSGDQWCFSNACGLNRAPFLKSGFETLDKISKVYVKLLGYPAPNGDWPWCRSRSDVIKLLHFLAQDQINENFIALNWFV